MTGSKASRPGREAGGSAWPLSISELHGMTVLLLEAAVPWTRARCEVYMSALSAEAVGARAAIAQQLLYVVLP